MKLVYLRVNMAWVFLLGDSIIPMNGKRLFSFRHQAISAAKKCRLSVSRGGDVELEAV